MVVMIPENFDQTFILWKGGSIFSEYMTGQMCDPSSWQNALCWGLARPEQDTLVLRHRRPSSWPLVHHSWFSGVKQQTAERCLGQKGTPKCGSHWGACLNPGARACQTHHEVLQKCLDNLLFCFSAVLIWGISLMMGLDQLAKDIA